MSDVSPQNRFIRWTRTTGAIFAILGVAATAAEATAQDTGACAGLGGHCMETTPFAATVVDFRSSQAGNQRLVTISVRFRNKLNRPLVLGYVDKSGVSIDDQGARYEVSGNNAVRGLGLITHNRFDPKFVLLPGESSDARLEFVWRHSANQLFGTAWNIDLTVREIDPAATNQFRLGREHALRFTGFTDRGVTVAGGPATPPAPPAGTPPVGGGPPVPVVPIADPCADKPRCASTSAFVAEVVSLVDSREGTYDDHVLRYTVRIRNTSNQPLVLAYSRNSSGAVDNLGQRYAPSAHIGRDEAQGIGVAYLNRIDPQFQLRPGEARNAIFTVERRVGQTEIGTRYTWDVALQEIQLLNGGQLRSLREHALGFRDLSPSVIGGVVADDVVQQNIQQGAQKAIDAIGGLFKKKKKP